MTDEPTPAVAGIPRLLLRLEGAALLIVAVAMFWHLDGSWRLFAILILAPDLSFLGYLAGPRAGAVAYNAAHATLAPLALIPLGVLATMPTAMAIALIWLAHIGADRMLGYGLKYAAGFGFTHLGRVGKT